MKKDENDMKDESDANDEDVTNIEVYIHVSFIIFRYIQVNIRTKTANIKHKKEAQHDLPRSSILRNVLKVNKTLEFKELLSLRL